MFVTSIFSFTHIVLSNIKLSSANALNLDKGKVLLSGKGFKHIICVLTLHDSDRSKLVLLHIDQYAIKPDSVIIPTNFDNVAILLMYLRALISKHALFHAFR